MNLYAATATTFTTNGLMILNPSSAEVREQVNGDFALTATFPQDDSTYLIEDRILTCNTPRGKQPFRIREISKTLDGSVEIYAPHLFYDLNDFFIEDIYPTADTGLEAITAILGATTEVNGFTGSSNIATTQNARYVMKSPVSCLLDKSQDDCFLNRWGGEILRDGYSIAINTRIGADNGVQIRYRKNLTGLTARTDLSTVKTRVLPTGLNANDTLLEGAYVDSAYISTYAHPKVGRAHFSDVKVGLEVDGAIPYATEAAALAELASRAALLFTNGLDVPTITLDVEFADLSQTVEYAQYSALETVSLGDTVTVIHEPLNVNCSLRVTEYTYDPSLQRYVSLIIGALPENIGTSVIAADVDISAIKDDLEQGVIRRGEKYNAVYINHDDGFVAEATISAKVVKTMMNATDGIKIIVDNVKVFGVDSTGRVFAQSVSNIADTTSFAEFGAIPGGGVGLNLSVSDTAFCRIAATGAGPYGFAILDATDAQRINVLIDGGFIVHDLNNEQRIVSDANGDFVIHDANGVIQQWLNQSGNFGLLRAINGASYNEVGVDATGAYKITAGVKAYL